MSFIRTVVLTLTALSTTFASAGTPPSKADRPEVHSNLALVIDVQDGSPSVLFARQADKAVPIASLTKLMTSLVVIEGGQRLEEEILITREDRDGTRGAASRLSVGVKLTRAELLHLALMSSDNRAAHALGRTFPGGTPGMVRAMNRKAKELGMNRSRFTDTSGLSAGNVASANDIAKLVLAVSNHPEIREYSTDGAHSVVLAKQQAMFRNTNYLVNKPDWTIEVQKTGYTSKAGQCLAMKTVIDGRSLVIVLLDSFGKYTRTADARRIRRWVESRAKSALAAAG